MHFKTTKHNVKFKHKTEKKNKTKQNNNIITSTFGDAQWATVNDQFSTKINNKLKKKKNQIKYIQSNSF